MPIIPPRLQRIIPDDLQVIYIIRTHRFKLDDVRVERGAHFLMTAPTYHAWAGFTQCIERVRADVAFTPVDSEFVCLLVERNPSGSDRGVHLAKPDSHDKAA